MFVGPVTCSRRTIPLVLIAAAIPTARPAAMGKAIAIVASPDLPADNLSLSELRHLMLGDREYWSSNLRVTLLVHAPAAREREVVLKTIYRMSEARFRQYWIDKLVGAPADKSPRILYSDGTVAGLAAAIPGAIAFVNAGQVPRGVKVLRIEGLLPREQGYPLR